MTRHGGTDGQGSGGPSFGVTKTDVNIDGLASFRSLLSRELSQNLEPGTQQILDSHYRGCGFGSASQSNQVYATQYQYAIALRDSTANMQTYVQTAQVLIDVMQEVIDNYSETDLTAANLVWMLGQRLNAPGNSPTETPV